MKITNLPSGALQVNTYLAVDEETNKGFIVDPGGYNPVLTKKVKEENIDIEYIILTHGHSDHICGANEHKADFEGCKIVACAEEEEMLHDIRWNCSADFGMPYTVDADIYVNDGDELRRTLQDLGGLMPNISSMAVVPVGVTKYRENLYPLKTFDKKGAGKTIDIIEEFQAEFLEKYGTRVVFPSDEFFLTAERELPDMAYYEDFPQFENGVGMLRSLIDEFENAIDSAEYSGGERHITVVTGYCPYTVIKKLAEMAESRFSGLKCDVMPIRNDFFGNTITVTGLITAGDLISQLKGRDNGSELLISSSMLMQNSEIFLDDMTVSDVEKALDIKIKITQNDGYELLDAILGM